MANVITKEFDIVVIGGGPAGYVAAIRSAQLGFKVACVDKWRDNNGHYKLGGTCLNAGCIPSKSLLQSSEHYVYAKNDFHKHGIKIKNIAVDIHKMIEHKDQIVNKLTNGIKQLFEINKIEWIKGSGKLLPDNKISIEETSETSETSKTSIISAKNIILATGSVPANIPIAQIDHDRIIDSTDALSLPEIPDTLGIIGAGVIGLEMATIWSRLGTKVTLFESAPELLTSVDKDVRKDAAKHFEKQDFIIHTNVMVTKSETTTKNVSVTFKQINNQTNQTNETDEQTLVFDYLLVAAGRKPCSDNITDKEVKLEMDGKFVRVDKNCATNIPNVFAIGDLVRGPMLAHKGSEEGIAVADHIAGLYSHVNYDLVPWVIFTNPEIAWVGKTEQECVAEGKKIKTGMFPFAASGRAQAINDTKGFVKVIADAKTDKLLGIHIIGFNASELIHEAVVAMEFGASAEDLARIMHAHPTLSEAIHEAALAVDKRAIHIANISNVVSK